MTYLKRIFTVILTVIAIINLFIIFPSAAGTNTGTAVIAIEAFTVDGGFILLPTEVQVTGNSSVATLLNNTLGRSEINFGSGAGREITNVAVSHSNTLGIVNNDLQDALSGNYGSSTAYNGWLSEGDFTTNSKWVVIVGNNIGTEGADYIPKSGDVVRVSFSLYGNGADLAIGNIGSATAVFSSRVNRDDLYKKMAEHKTNSDFDLDFSVLRMAANLNASQVDLDYAVDFMNEEFDTFDPQSPGYDDIITPDDGDYIPDDNDYTPDFYDTSDDIYMATTPAPTDMAETPATTVRPPVASVTTPPATNSVDVIPNRPTAPTGVNLLGAIPLVVILGGLIFLSRRRKK